MKTLKNWEVDEVDRRVRTDMFKTDQRCKGKPENMFLVHGLKLTGSVRRGRKSPSVSVCSSLMMWTWYIQSVWCRHPSGWYKLRHRQQPYLPDTVGNSLKHFHLLRRRQPSIHGENTEVLFHSSARKGPSLFYEHRNNSLHFLLQPQQDRGQNERDFTLISCNSHLNTKTAPK